MKTAMQELIEHLNVEMKEKGILPNWDMYLEKEKNQLNVHFISGCIEAISSSTPVRDRIMDGYFENKAEQYYNHIYKINNL